MLLNHCSASLIRVNLSNLVGHCHYNRTKYEEKCKYVVCEMIEK